MAEIQNDQTDIEPLNDETLEEVAGGSSGGCCSCSGCSASGGGGGTEEPAPQPDIILA